MLFRSISINSNYADAHWSKSIIKLLLGEYEEGWALYEWRWESGQSHPIENYTHRLWLGNEPIKNKVILIHAEQGFGDNIQFCRYIKLIENLEPRKIILSFPKELIKIISTLDSKFEIIDRGGLIPEFDIHCSLLSLPHALKTTLNNIPASIPYLFADTIKTQHWREKLGKKSKPRIGVTWSGSRLLKNDHNRSLLLNQLVPLFDLPLEFHALQKEIRACDLEVLNKLKQVKLHQDELLDFSDTAALIECMDLIISVDTSIAHLAGALGKEVFIMLPFAPDFRWMMNRKDSPWYPKAKLFRQEKLHDWDSVVGILKSELSNFKI